MAAPVPCLDAQPLYKQLAPGKSVAKAAAQCAEFVAQRHGIALWDTSLKQHIYLGDDAFWARVQRIAGVDSSPTGAQRISVTFTPVRESNVQLCAAPPVADKEQRKKNSQSFLPKQSQPNSYCISFWCVYIYCQPYIG